MYNIMEQGNESKHFVILLSRTYVKAKIFLQNRKPKKNPFIREIDREKTSEKG